MSSSIVGSRTSAYSVKTVATTRAESPSICAETSCVISRGIPDGLAPLSLKPSEASTDAGHDPLSSGSSSVLERAGGEQRRIPRALPARRSPRRRRGRRQRRPARRPRSRRGPLGPGLSPSGSSSVGGRSGSPAARRVLAARSPRGPRGSLAGGRRGRARRAGIVVLEEAGREAHAQPIRRRRRRRGSRCGGETGPPHRNMATGSRATLRSRNLRRSGLAGSVPRGRLGSRSRWGVRRITESGG